jgi:hypothetical protein
MVGHVGIEDELDAILIVASHGAVGLAEGPAA